MAAELFSVFYQFADVFAFLILSAAGLAIVFGMMGVINLAHGEFIMCGAYVTVGLVKLGVPLAIAHAVKAAAADRAACPVSRSPAAGPGPGRGTASFGNADPAGAAAGAGRHHPDRSCARA